MCQKSTRQFFRMFEIWSSCFSIFLKMNSLTVVIIACLASNCVATKVTNELDLKYLLENLRPEECLYLLSGLEGKILQTSTGESLTCSSHLEKVLRGLPVIEISPVLGELLNRLNRTDIALDIHEQYLHANAQTVQTYLISLESRNDSATNDSIIYNPLRDLIKEKIFSNSLQTEELSVHVPTSNVFISLFFMTGLFSFILVIYTVWLALVDRTNEHHGEI